MLENFGGRTNYAKRLARETAYIYEYLDEEGEAAIYPIEVVRLPELRLAAVGDVGSYMRIGRAFDQLFGTLAARGQIAPGMRSIGVYLDDPSTVAEDRLRAQAGIVIGEGFALAPPLEAATVSGGICTVLPHKGPYADLRAAYDWLFGEWLMHAGREADDAPVFEEYLNNPRDTAPQDLRTDIHLKLREVSS